MDLTNSTLLLKSINENYEDIDGYIFHLGTIISANNFITDNKIDNGIKGVLYGLSRDKKYIEESERYAVLKTDIKNIVYLQDNLYKCPNAYVCFVGNKADSYSFMVNNHNINDHILKKIIDKSNFYIKEYNMFFVDQYFAKYEDEL